MLTSLRWWICMTSESGHPTTFCTVKILIVESSTKQVYDPPLGRVYSILVDFVFNFGILRGSVYRRVNSLVSLLSPFEFFPCQSDNLWTGKPSNFRFYCRLWYRFWHDRICMTVVIQIHINSPISICMSWEKIAILLQEEWNDLFDLSKLYE